jgi:hypothetical protein
MAIQRGWSGECSHIVKKDALVPLFCGARQWYADSDQDVWKAVLRAFLTIRLSRPVNPSLSAKKHAKRPANRQLPIASALPAQSLQVIQLASAWAVSEHPAAARARLAALAAADCAQCRP